MNDDHIVNPKLPPSCFHVLETSGELVLLKNGEQGYYPCTWSTDNAEQNKRTAAYANARLGISEIEVQAMVNGSMFGWNTPAADPDLLKDKQENCLHDQIQSAQARKQPSQTASASHDRPEGRGS